MSGLELDLETRSDVDLKKRGAYVYFASPHTRVLMASYRLNGRKGRWREGQPCPAEIVAHVEAGGQISAHNAAFERLAWWSILTPRHGWPRPKLEQFRCTAATAAALALPRDLGGLGAALGLSVQKDRAGKALINKFSKPRKARKGEDDLALLFNEPAHFPDDFERFHDYCDIDVETEAAADARMIPLPADEQDLWHIDQRINDRGVRIDRASALAAKAIADKAKLALDDDMREVTGGAVKKCSEVAALVRWIEAQGITLPSAAKADLLDILKTPDLPKHVRKAVEIRQEAAKTSIAKLDAMLERAGADDRARGLFLFCAAGTGRWSSLGIQLQNLPRPRPMFDDAHLDRAALFQAFRDGDTEWLAFMYGPTLGRPLDLIADAMRGFLWAAPGHEFVQADYSGIEGAVAAWFADEHWKVEYLHFLQSGQANGAPDMYVRTAGSILNLPPEKVTKHMRQAVGKISELSLGYQGGVVAFHSMSRNYNIDLDPLFEPVWATADEERRAKAVKRYETCLKRNDSKTDVLSRNAWIACEIIKVGWRATNPAIAAAWHLLEAGIREAIENPGQQITVLKCTYLVAHGFLWCRLPSGRCLAYASPRLKAQVWAKRKVDGEWLDAEVMDREDAEKLQMKGKAEIQGETSPKATALGVDSQTKKWVRFALYGGLAFENIVQAIARDLLANGIRKAEGAGYPVVMHVHDEIVTEVPRGFGDVKAFEKLICELPEWAAGLPLTSGGWRGKRYRKD